MFDEDFDPRGCQVLLALTATPRHYWQTKPSADRLGNEPWRHGPLQPLAESKPRWWPWGRKA